MYFYLKEEWRAPVIGVISFSVGVGTGYLIANKRNKTQVIVEVDQPNEQLAWDFARAAEEQVHRPIHITPTPVNPRWASDTGPATYNNPSVRPVRSGHVQEVASDIPIDPEPELQNEYEWNQEEEESERSPDSPYVISREEFDVGTDDYSQTSLEYFAADSVLCDQNRVPIYNPEKIVGRLEFGRGSGESNVVFIRNESLKSEFEVTRNEGSYQVEVLGLEVEDEYEQQDLKHANSMPRFKMD
jgi:hypothetical protein